MIIDKKLIGQIQEEIEDYNRKQLDFAPSYAPTQKEIIDLIDYYWVDKFKDGDVSISGWKKMFYNIIQFPSLVSSKMIDLDTKDIRVIAEDGNSYYPAWIFKKDLNFWMKDKEFGKLLNSFVYDFPKYGSIVAKKVKDEIFNVPMRNLYMKTDVDELSDSPYLIEEHKYTSFMLKKQSWDKDTIKQVIEEEDDEDEICIYERFGDWSDNKNYHIISETGIVLYSGKVDNINLIYRKLDWDKIKGRMLGRGQVEKLFETQIQMNKIENYRTEGLHWSSKHLFQTRDSTFNKNLTTDVDNGDVLFVTSELTEVNNSERNLAAYGTAEERLDKVKRELTFAYPELAGERPPAGTTLGTSIIQAQQASGYFDLKREEFGMWLKDIIIDWVIPTFEKNRKNAHKLMLSEFNDEELQKLRGLFITYHSNEEIMKFITKNKRIPSQEEVDLLKGITEKQIKNAKDLDIPAKFYDNIKYKVDVVITNEQMDTTAKQGVLQTVLGLLSTNPAILENPKTKKLFYQLLDLSGISPIDLQLDEVDTKMDMAVQSLQRGGSLAKSVIPTTPSLQSNQTVI